MNKFFLTLLAIGLSFTSLDAQRVMKWSIGKVVIDAENTSEVCYPLQISISDDSRTPELGTSTLRFFYDSGLLSGLNFRNIESGYSISGLKESRPVFGHVFNFESQLGVFVGLNIIENSATKIGLSTTPVHILDMCFTVSPEASFPLCAPIVFDENHVGAGNGIEEDDGYIKNDAGIIGTYYLNNDDQVLLLADDEVVNFLWEKHTGFDGELNDLSDDIGMTIENGCIDLPDATTSTGGLNVGADAITVEVSPNPVIAGQEVNLQLFPSISEPQEFVVYDALGHVVYRVKTSSTATIPTDRLKVGLYYLHAVDGGVISKIVVH